MAIIEANLKKARDNINAFLNLQLPQPRDKEGNLAAIALTLTIGLGILKDKGVNKPIESLGGYTPAKALQMAYKAVRHYGLKPLSEKSIELLSNNLDYLKAEEEGSEMNLNRGSQ